MIDPKITMTLLVRDEEDIIEDMLRFHRAQGVDSFIVMNNLSTDRTPGILKKLSQEFPILVLQQNEDNYSQSKWVTQMARQAAIDGADWVINSDADEFWLPSRGRLKDYLAALPEDVRMVKVMRHNAAVIRKASDILQKEQCHPRKDTVFEVVSRNNMGDSLPGKMLHRADPDVVVEQGNHTVTGIIGRKVLSGGDLVILHFPYRSLTRYRSKINYGGAAYMRNLELRPEIGATWREHFKKRDSGELEKFWDNLVLTKQEATIGLLSGKLFRDERLMQTLDGRSDSRRKLHEAQYELRTRSQEMIDEFARDMAEFIDRMPREVRSERPLYYNLEFCVSGPYKQLEMLKALLIDNTPETLCRSFPKLRDAFSLFPRNNHLRNFLRKLIELAYPEDTARLRRDCAGRYVVLHATCQERIERAEASAASFSKRSDLHHIHLVGDRQTCSENEMPLSFSYDGCVLRVPAPDDYENLHRKLFYAYMIFDLIAEPKFVVKIDDNIQMGNDDEFNALMTKLTEENVVYAGRVVGAQQHKTQWHGWHLSKCTDPLVETRGYQYPLPRKYAAGGYGYILGCKGLAACSYMYLAMKEFFSMRAVGLEDACVGHAAYAEEIELYNVSTEKNLLALPGLVSFEAKQR